MEIHPVINNDFLSGRKKIRRNEELKMAVK